MRKGIKTNAALYNHWADFHFLGGDGLTFIQIIVSKNPKIEYNSAHAGRHFRHETGERVLHRRPAVRRAADTAQRGQS